MFFPRGGSAHVARALARELPAHGWDVTRPRRARCPAASATPGASTPGSTSTRSTSTPATRRCTRPTRTAPTRRTAVFAAVDDAGLEAHVAAWSRALEEAGAADADVLHLHHLTPIHEAAARVAPGVPVVGHLHGTELLMLERIADGPPAGWPHAEALGARACAAGRGAASGCCCSPQASVERAARLLGIDPARCVVAPNGFDPERFAPRDVDRAALWRQRLVDEPRGWRPGGDEGSRPLPPAQVGGPGARARAAVASSRFTEVKRLGLLIRAFARARRRRRAGRRPRWSSLGGYPGEWEGEHPLRRDRARRARATSTWPAGTTTTSCPTFFAAADALALASVREQFGSVLVEGMACGLPPVAVDRFGPGRHRAPTADGLAGGARRRGGAGRRARAAIDHPEERRRRGIAARGDVAARFAWPALADRLCRLFGEVAATPEEDAAVAAARYLK